jgi:hypothetical protein
MKPLCCLFGFHSYCYRDFEAVVKGTTEVIYVLRKSVCGGCFKEKWEQLTQTKEE